MRADILKFIFVGSMATLSLSSAYAQTTMILDCTYSEGTHVQRTRSAGGGEEWMPAHEVIYRICDGCTINDEASREAGAASGIDRSRALPVWKITEDEYSYEYGGPVDHGGVRINRYSGAATNELHTFDDGSIYVAGRGTFFVSHGTCKKVDKPRF